MRAKLFFLTMLGAAPLAAHADPAPRAPLVRVLQSPDQIPTADQVRALDADGSALRAIATDRAQTRYLRVRAASLLGLYDRPEVRAALAALADAAADDVEVRVQALDALARLEGPAGEARLVRALGSEQRVLREVAVIGLARRGSRDVLVRHRRVEKDPAINARIDALRP